MNEFFRSLLKFAGFLFFLLLIVSASITFLFTREAVIPPHIEPQKTNLTVPAVNYMFPFGNTKITVTSPVDPSVYVGAKTAEKETLVRGNVSYGTWLRRTYLAMIDDPAQDQFYHDLIRDLQSIREKNRLDSDENLELATIFVQSIRYETIGENPPKFPVETYVDASGDCDDKSLLLTGILSREGYNVSLLSFGPETHMAVGVVCPGADYQQTGYAFIETTNISFVGVPTNILGNGVPLRSHPEVIPVGNGTKIYTGCGETLYLDATLRSSERNVSDLTVRINTLKAEMDEYFARNDINNYNLRVQDYNDLQNRRLQYAQIHNYILDHQFDRNGTYHYVKDNLPT